MVEQQEMVRCLKCGYALHGLPARKCEDCGHVYLRCPECGTSQIANEAQNRFLMQMRDRAAKLPGRIQVAQILLLVMLGTLWIVIGFGGGANGENMEWGARLAMAGVAALCASLVRLLVFRSGNPWASLGGATAFLTSTFAVGLLFGWGNAHTEIVYLLALAAYVAVGAGIGAWGAEVIGWAILWLFAKDEDRALLTRTHRGESNGRSVHGDGMGPVRNLMYCTHCAAELPALASSTCSDCGLEQVTCPICGKHCGVSDALAGMLNVAKVTQSVSAGVWVGVRAVAAVFMWVQLVSIVLEIERYGATWGRGTPASGFWISPDPNTVVHLLILIGVLTWFVFVKGALWSSLLCMVMMLTAAWFLMAGGPGSFRPPWTRVAVLVVGTGAASLLAWIVGWLVRASLPKRRVAMLEEVVPELAREPGPARTEA